MQRRPRPPLRRTSFSPRRLPSPFHPATLPSSRDFPQNARWTLSVVSLNCNERVRTLRSWPRGRGVEALPSFARQRGGCRPVLRTAWIRIRVASDHRAYRRLLTGHRRLRPGRVWARVLEVVSTLRSRSRPVATRRWWPEAPPGIGALAAARSRRRGARSRSGALLAQWRARQSRGQGSPGFVGQRVHGQGSPDRQGPPASRLRVARRDRRHGESRPRGRRCKCREAASSLLNQWYDPFVGYQSVGILKAGLDVVGL